MAVILPKSIPDYESAGAVWAKVEKGGMDKLVYRGSEPLYWREYIKNGGEVYPLKLLANQEK